MARRLDSHCASMRTRVEFSPRHYQQMAGLCCYYNSLKYHYWLLTRDEEAGTCLRVLSRHPESAAADSLSEPVSIPDGVPVELFAEIDFERLRFGFRLGNQSEGAGGVRWLPQTFDASILSDEATEAGRPNFTGTFVGMACQDMSGEGRYADFDYFEYRARPYRVDPTR